MFSIVNELHRLSVDFIKERGCTLENYGECMARTLKNYKNVVNCLELAANSIDVRIGAFVASECVPDALLCPAVWISSSEARELGVPLDVSLTEEMGVLATAVRHIASDHSTPMSALDAVMTCTNDLKSQRILILTALSRGYAHAAVLAGWSNHRFECHPTTIPSSSLFAGTDIIPAMREAVEAVLCDLTNAKSGDGVMDYFLKCFNSAGYSVRSDLFSPHHGFADIPSLVYKTDRRMCAVMKPLYGNCTRATIPFLNRMLTAFCVQ